MEMRANQIKQKLANNEVVSVAAGFNHADDIDAFGPSGFDGVWIEGEHGGMSFEDLGNMTRACDLWGMNSVVRVNRNDQNLIYRTLDRGAQGIVVPHVNTKAEAENVVAGGKFAPIGQRGMFTSRQGYGVSNYFEHANDHSLLIVLIEDIVAAENLDEILEVDHIDVFFVAPSDFGASMGYIHDLGNEVVTSKIKETMKRIVAAGRTTGTMCTNETAAQFVDIGVQFFLTGIGGWLQSGAADFLHRIQKKS
jgi:2-dehydro-3-deoxy-L-rhamnonate aldolase